MSTPQKKFKKDDDDLPSGWSRDDYNKYANDQYENERSRRAGGEFGGNDINQPVRNVYDPTKAMDARDYQGDFPYRAPRSQDVRFPKTKYPYKAAEFNEQGVQINDMSPKKKTLKQRMFKQR